MYIKKYMNASRPSEHPPVRGKKMSNRSGGIISCKDKTCSRHLVGFPNGSSIESTLLCREKPTVMLYTNMNVLYMKEACVKGCVTGLFGFGVPTRI